MNDSLYKKEAAKAKQAEVNRRKTERAAKLAKVGHKRKRIQIILQKVDQKELRKWWLENSMVEDRSNLVARDVRCHLLEEYKLKVQNLNLLYFVYSEK
jgi:hypothetical protein